MTTNSLSPWAVRMYLVNWRVGIYAADLSCAGTGFVTIRRLRTATLLTTTRAVISRPATITTAAEYAKAL